jgi:hypothetical protein
MFYARLEGLIAVSAGLTPGLLWLAREAYVASGGTLRLGLARNAPHRPTDVLNHAQPLAFRG